MDDRKCRNTDATSEKNAAEEKRKEFNNVGEISGAYWGLWGFFPSFFGRCGWLFVDSTTRTRPRLVSRCGGSLGLSSTDAAAPSCAASEQAYAAPWEYRLAMFDSPQPTSAKEKLYSSR